MKDTKCYNREKTELFYTKFLVLLDTYPFIYEIGEEVIVKSFFNKLKPTSLSSQLLFLELKTIAEASVALEDCFMRKDLVLEEFLLDNSLSTYDNNEVIINFKAKDKREDDNKKQPALVERRSNHLKINKTVKDNRGLKKDDLLKTLIAMAAESIFEKTFLIKANSPVMQLNHLIHFIK